MNWIRNKQQWRDYLLITLGTAVMAVATSSIYDPAGLVTGGFSGLAIVIKQLSQMLFGKGVPLWVTNLVLNIPLFLFGIRIMFIFLKPGLIWKLTEEWKSYRADEPSEFYLKTTKIGGILFALFGIIMIMLPVILE